QLGNGSLVETRVPGAGLPAELRLGLRPEAVRVGSGTAAISAKVELIERLGDRALIYAKLADGQPIVAEDEGDSKVKIGDDVPLNIDGPAAHLFGADGAAYHRAEA